jgi:hypothetical protein
MKVGNNLPCVLGIKVSGRHQSVCLSGIFGPNAAFLNLLFGKRPQ